jgi:hypothetical protein
MAAVSDVSIEFAHLYLANLDEEHAEASARLAKQWLAPVIAGYEEAGLTVSTVVMIDDYFAPEGTEIEEKARMLQDACMEAGVRVDHVAYEAACAESVEQMQARLHQEPRRGDGSSSPPPADTGSDWLSNGDPPRGKHWEPATVGRLFRQPEEGKGQAGQRAKAHTPARGHHSIHLDVQLWKSERGSDSRLWACPTLAAWWQLIRLGMLRDERSDRPVAPPRTQSLPNAPPLAARRTLTLLDNRFLEVEHAVRAILERLSLPEGWRRYLREGEELPSPHAHLERIAYIFVPADFELRA